jgi:hypothetical protein
MKNIFQIHWNLSQNVSQKMKIIKILEILKHILIFHLAWVQEIVLVRILLKYAFIKLFIILIYFLMYIKMEAKIILIKLIKNFDFELVPNQNLGAVQFATIRPIDGTKCFIYPRK